MKKPKTSEQLTGPGRAPYEPPAVVSEETFETLALQCGKADDGFDCAIRGGKQS